MRPGSAAFNLFVIIVWGLSGCDVGIHEKGARKCEYTGNGPVLIDGNRSIVFHGPCNAGNAISALRFRLVLIGKLNLLVTSGVVKENFLKRHMDVSENSGTSTPKSSILMSFYIINYHPFWGVSLFLVTPIYATNFSMQH